ncbi:RDD family protein [Butyricicoccus sp. 1XD8-22]|nr:RDD family protein [Butyricicoccus sp. 1XD8-22]
MGIAIYPIFTLMNWDLSDSALFAPITIISAIVYFGYFVLMTKFFQQTLGKMIFGLKVQSKHGEKLNWSTVLFREIIGRYINNKVPILYFFVIFMPKNLSLADYFSDTLVVYENAFVKKKKIPSIQQPIVNPQFSQTPNM